MISDGISQGSMSNILFQSEVPKSTNECKMSAILEAILLPIWQSWSDLSRKCGQAQNLAFLELYFHYSHTAFVGRIMMAWGVVNLAF